MAIAVVYFLKTIDINDNLGELSSISPSPHQFSFQEFHGESIICALSKAVITGVIVQLFFVAILQLRKVTYRKTCSNKDGEPRKQTTTRQFSVGEMFVRGNFQEMYGNGDKCRARSAFDAKPQPRDQEGVEISYGNTERSRGSPE